MGMKVLAYTNSPRPTPESRRDKGYIVPGTGDPDGSLPIAWHSGASKAALHEFLSQDLDYILIAVPLTPETTGLLGAEEFQILSKSCTRVGRRPFLTNIARGKVIDQDALINSLKSGELGGAALDVADPEPLPADHPLWDAPNVHITPHMSALGVEYLGRAFDVLKENLRRMQRGEDLVNVYKRRRGY
jgi:phosphoglycerate dehydrogenase-like enzyme